MCALGLREGDRALLELVLAGRQLLLARVESRAAIFDTPRLALDLGLSLADLAPTALGRGRSCLGLVPRARERLLDFDDGFGAALDLRLTFGDDRFATLDDRRPCFELDLQLRERVPALGRLGLA
ncbi:MAG TPA: hypothetical protein VJ814_10890, partial [Gaiellaceae bacterium]|nr:hypothetical protein [Gaiellaceae bacterium]